MSAMKPPRETYYELTPDQVAHTLNELPKAALVELVWDFAVRMHGEGSEGPSLKTLCVWIEPVLTARKKAQDARRRNRAKGAGA